MSSDLALLLAQPPPDAPVADDPLSERILDATLALVAASGARHLTMDDVAREARAGRMTVYRRFGDKAGLLAALTRRESVRAMASLAVPVAGDGAPLVDQLAANAVAALRIAREHPLLNRLARHEPEQVIAALADGGALFSSLRRFAVEQLRVFAARARVQPPADIDSVAELLVRLGVSFVLIQPADLPLDDDARARRAMRRLVAPLLGAVT